MAATSVRELSHSSYGLLIAVVCIPSIMWVAWIAFLPEHSGAAAPERTPGETVTDAGFVAGTVVGPQGPLTNATVRWQANDAAVTTDHEGRFRLPRIGDATRIAVSAPSHYVATCPDGSANPTLLLRPLPTHDNTAYAWIDPSPSSTSRHRCSLCHERIYAEWLSSAHARAGSNPRVLSLIEGMAADGVPHSGPSLRRDQPHGVAVCNSCHAPTLETSDPHWDKLATRPTSSLNGVHCDFCHKVQSVDLSNVGLTHGRYAMQLLRPEGDDQLVFGPHDDANRDDSAASPLYRSSRYCASCHEGTVFGVEAYTTFSEWEASPAAARKQQCQTCHMPAAADVTNMAPGRGGVPRPSTTLSDHSFGGPASRRYTDSLAISLATSRGDGLLHVGVSLDASRVGHYVPTGFIDKHLLLIVDAFDANGSQVSQAAGPRLPEFAGQSVGGRAGEVFGRVLTDSRGGRPAAFWAGIVEQHDTRIRPDTPRTVRLSFDGMAEHLRIRVLHRRFWEKTRSDNRWADDTTPIVDCRCEADAPPPFLLNPGQEKNSPQSPPESADG